ITIERLALARVVLRHVDDERRRRAVVDEVVAEPLRPPRLGVGLVASQAAAEYRRPQHLAGGDVIRVAIVPVGDGDAAWTMAADDVDRGADDRGLRLDAAVGPPEVLAPRRAQYARGRGRLGLPLIRRAVARQLAARQIAQPDA